MNRQVAKSAKKIFHHEATKPRRKSIQNPNSKIQNEFSAFLCVLCGKNSSRLIFAASGFGGFGFWHYPQFSRGLAQVWRGGGLPHRNSQFSGDFWPKGRDMTTTPVSTAQNTNQIKSSTKMSLKTEDFIKMMVTQLQNQDPMDPMKNQDLLAQMSQIGQLQSTTSLQSSITSMMTQNQIGAASSLIGKVVQGMDAQKNTVQGQVNSVLVQSDGVVLQLDNGAQLPLGNVTAITSTATLGTATGT
jgi:flagellar basal-body rod modification protein FlgD